MWRRGFFVPIALAADGKGNVYVGDYASLRRVAANGNVMTIAGPTTATSRGSLDGAGLTPASQPSPMSPSTAAGNLYLANREVVLSLTPAGVVSTAIGQRGSVGLRIGPLPGNLGGSVSWMTMAPDGVLHLISENALVKVRFN